MIALEILTAPATLLETSSTGVVVEFISEGVQGPKGRDADITIDVVGWVADGQVDFALTLNPSNPAKVRMHINGQQFRAPSFTITGQAVRWQSEFLITATDEIEFSYPI
jgi:hypothetical protein